MSLTKFYRDISDIDSYLAEAFLNPKASSSLKGSLIETIPDTYHKISADKTSQTVHVMVPGFTKEQLTELVDSIKSEPPKISSPQSAEGYLNKNQDTADHRQCRESANQEAFEEGSRNRINLFIVFGWTNHGFAQDGEVIVDADGHAEKGGSEYPP